MGKGTEARERRCPSVFGGRQAEQIGRVDERLRALERRVVSIERDRERRRQVSVTWLQVLAAGIFVIVASLGGSLLIILTS